MSKKAKKNDIKSALLAEGGQGNENLVMKNLQDRMSEAHKRMEKANEKKGLMEKLEVINPIKGLQKASETGGKMFKYVNQTNIFRMYGLLDIAILVFLIYITIKNKKGLFFIIAILLYVPNVMLFIVMLFQDSIAIRYWYQRYLRFKLVFLGFVLPLVILH